VVSGKIFELRYYFGLNTKYLSADASRILLKVK